MPSETSLEFTISKGVELISIKDLSDYTKKEVNDYVDAVGLTVKFTEEYSDSVEKGLVISQSPEARTNLKKGTEISVVLSKGKKEVQPKEVMKEIAKDKKTIFLSTHILDVAEKLCDRVAIIKKGKIIKVGKMKDIKGDSSLEKVFLELGE